MVSAIRAPFLLDDKFIDFRLSSLSQAYLEIGSFSRFIGCCERRQRLFPESRHPGNKLVPWKRFRVEAE